VVGDACENIGLFHVGAGVVDAWAVDDHNGLAANLGFDDADLASA